MNAWLEVLGCIFTSTRASCRAGSMTSRTEHSTRKLYVNDDEGMEIAYSITACVFWPCGAWRKAQGKPGNTQHMSKAYSDDRGKQSSVVGPCGVEWDLQVLVNPDLLMLLLFFLTPFHARNANNFSCTREYGVSSAMGRCERVEREPKLSLHGKN